MNYTTTTEHSSPYQNLEKMSVQELLTHINAEDHIVPKAVKKALPQIEALVHQIVKKLQHGGRLFYVGAGTSGRLGIVDASECPPTFGVPNSLVIGLIAGGDSAIRNAVEFAEDDPEKGWKDLLEHQISSHDVVVGIAASGVTPYVVGAILECRKNNVITGGITCNKNSPLALTSQYPIEVVVGPEFVTGSSRMKAGTAQKMVLNMLSTATMIQLGKVKGNMMVDMQLSNKKLKDRGLQMLITTLHISREKATTLLNTYKNVRAAIVAYTDGNR